MQTNTLPKYDESDNATGCCARFNPEGWDGQELHFEDKRFLRARTHSAMHIPLDMGRVFTRVGKHIQDARAYDPDDYIVMSHDTSPWSAEHYFAVTKDVEDEEMVTLSGDYVTHVFEGPYREAREWEKEFAGMLREKGRDPKEIYWFYTTCPKCAKTYGKNYVVGVAEV